MRHCRPIRPRRPRAVLAALATALALGAPAQAGGVAPKAEQVAAWRATCTHYGNRARFKSRATQVEFVTVIADGCAAALATLETSPQTGDAPQRAAAARLLDRLTAARTEISAINARRLAEAAARRAKDRSFSRFARDLARDRRLVGHSGEYLILRAEGVYAALGAWVDAGAEFALIAALPRRDG